MHNFRELKVWEKARYLYKDIYILTKFFPKEELFGLTSQIRRSAHSIPSNISEGCGRNSDKDLCRFIDMANGSAFELESHLILSNDLEFITDDELNIYLDKIKEIQKMLYNFRRSKE